jgi:hypothetical protein
MKKIALELAKQAKIKGICQEWYKDLKSVKDIGKLIEMYLKGIDFCLSNEFPSNEFIRENFEGKMEDYGIYLDKQISATNERKIVALGSCIGRIEVNEYAVSELFIKHNSDLILSATGNSFVMVDIFDNAKLKVFALDDAKVCINRYGGTVEITSVSEGKSVVKVIEKNQKTY